MFDGSYVHGYSTAEEIRLIRQANILAGFIHAGATFAPGARVLEAGCGVGAQTIELAARNPRTRFVAIDRSAKSVHIAQERVAACGLGNVEFQVADIYRLPSAALRNYGESCGRTRASRSSKATTAACSHGPTIEQSPISPPQ